MSALVFLIKIWEWYSIPIPTHWRKITLLKKVLYSNTFLTELIEKKYALPIVISFVSMNCILCVSFVPAQVVNYLPCIRRVFVHCNTSTIWCLGDCTQSWVVAFVLFPIRWNSIVLLQPTYNLVCSDLNCIFDTLHTIEAGIMFKN